MWYSHVKMVVAGLERRSRVTFVHIAPVSGDAPGGKVSGGKWAIPRWSSSARSREVATGWKAIP